MGEHAANIVNDIAKSMNPTRLTRRRRARSLDGGAISVHAQHRRHHHGTNPRASVVKQYLAELGLPQPVVVGANVFRTTPRTSDGPVGALAY